VAAFLLLFPAFDP
jgi:hypothetical protein